LVRGTYILSTKQANLFRGEWQSHSTLKSSSWTLVGSSRRCTLASFLQDEGNGKGANFPARVTSITTELILQCRGDSMPYKLCQRCSCEQSFFTLYLLLRSRELHSVGYILPLRNRPARLGSPRSRSNAKDSSMHYLQMPLGTATQLQPIITHEKSLVYDGSPGAAQVLRSRRSFF
jgi:hypothetical protein